MSTCPLPIVNINCHYIHFLSVVKRSCLPILSILILLKHTNCQLKSNSNIMFPVHDFDDRNVGMMYAWSLHFQRLENLEEVIKSFCKNFVFKNVEMHCIETASTVKIFYFSTTLMENMVYFWNLFSNIFIICFWPTCPCLQTTNSSRKWERVI